MSLALTNLFFDSRRLAAALAQVIKFCTAHITTTFHRDIRDARTMRLKNTLHTLAMRNLTHGESRIEAAIAFCDNDTFECL